MSTISIKATKYRCTTCLKTYNSKIWYDQHRFVCTFKSKSKKERILDEQRQQDLLSIEELSEVVKMLLIEQEKMKKEIEVLKRYNYSKRKQIDVLEYLNKNIKPIQTYTEWIESLKFSNEDLEILLHETYLTTMNKYFENLFGNIDVDDKILPIKGYTEKQNILYIYHFNENDENDENDENEKNLKWIKLNEDHWKLLIKHISKLVFDKFKEWQDKNENRFEEESFSLLYHSNVKKIMSNIGLPLTSFQKKIWNYIKLDFKNIVNYEI